MSLGAAASGFGLGFALITPIGAQNAYVLRTAVRAPRPAVFTVVAIVTAIDIVLIGIGALGAGAVLDGRDWLRVLLYAGGVALLLPLGIRTLKDGLRGGDDYAAALEADQDEAGGRGITPGAVIGPVLALSLLNPHVYLDTVAILGSAIATNDPSNRLSFTVGAMVASVIWFAFLAVLGAVVLRRYGARVARAVDLISGVVMLVVATIFVIEAIRLISG
ncbi:MAG: LysE family transporter [Patulibacter sp.]|nr:LysE family transporter [Patulibacter sp.]